MKLRLLWEARAWQEYCYWQLNDKKILKKIKILITDIQRNAFVGIGKPEPLKDNLSGWWSRRINAEHRIVYKKEIDSIIIASCKSHYQD